MIAYMLVNAFTGSVSVSCKVIPSFSATRREGKFACSSDNNRMLENPFAAFPCEIGSRCYVNYRMAFCVFAKNSVLVIVYTLVTIFTGSA